MPLRQLFTYEYSLPQPVDEGMRVLVPFGRRQLVGIVVRLSSSPPKGVKCKAALNVLDSKPVLDAPLLQLLRWASQYYQHPIGDVIQTALPKRLRQNKSLTAPQQTIYHAAKDSGAEVLSRAPQQQKLLALIDAAGVEGLSDEVLKSQSEQASIKNVRGLIKSLLEKRLVTQTVVELPLTILESSISSNKSLHKLGPIVLNKEQRTALQNIQDNGDEFHCTLLNGVTGSGKTEVYFSLIDRILEREQQVLVLFPEIALTTQLQQRFIQRFGAHNVVSLHSGLADKARNLAWLAAATGEVPIVLGTRLAVFTALQNVGLIVVDEEHDSSFKQQEGFRYQARSVAVKRASDLNIPIVLGSATPSLESLHNVAQGRYTQVHLRQRAATDKLPEVSFIDLNHYPADEGLSQPVLQALGDNLKRGEQSMVFINRRGFAPVLFCSHCQWVAPCLRCDAPLTQHKHGQRLNCHFCGAVTQTPKQCGQCGEEGLLPLGEGTQRIEQQLERTFPEAKITRFDRDVMASQQALEQGLQAVHDQEIDILVGTQLLTKGHDFDHVSLVAVVNADSGLHSHDYRSTELLAAQLIQVAGRAGRSKAGQVLIQSRHVQHPTLQAVAQHDYQGFAQAALKEREHASFPPYVHLALWRAHSPHPSKALTLLQRTAQMGRRLQPPSALLFDACKSPMEKLAGKYRAQLLISCTDRAALNRWVAQWVAQLEQNPISRSAKWSVDIDPIDLY